ncbi:MAG TPA: MarR family transcriptional regulator [Thermomicrobiales bacterium]|nr:MarR family transcriptional regulator [Thermomicrobiales bacterium]
MTSNRPSLPGPGEGKRGTSGYLGYLLRQAAGAHRLAVERALDDLRITPPQFLTMTLINAYPASSGADLARVALITPQTMSVIIANLEREGRVRRLVHPEHGRKQQLELTEQGQHDLAACQERVKGQEASLIDGFDRDEVALIRRWLVEVAVRDLGSQDLQTS